jgi:uncharacterized membrane protein HdeD (DUF308 family)
MYSRAVRPKQRHAWPGFVIFGVLAILGLFVLHGPAAGVTSLAALIAFILACIYALRSRNEPGTVAQTQRTGFTGWFGGWW